MMLPAVSRVLANMVGGTLATGGYVVAKVGEAAGGPKAVDSAAFRAGLTSWMWSNGVFPSVTYVAPADGGPAPGIAETPIVVSNHISYLDGAVLTAVFGAPRIVAKAGARQVPVAGRLMQEMEVIFVDRGDRDSK